MNQLLVFLFCLLGVAKGLAQEPRIIQHDIGEANAGLSFYTLIQDHQCMIWLGTANGLVYPVREEVMNGFLPGVA